MAKNAFSVHEDISIVLKYLCRELDRESVAITLQKEQMKTGNQMNKSTTRPHICTGLFA